ncbi:hypothetical protein DM01DRAFT_1339406 [Hesseltinella vesiculosa]|uniref:VPS9 domain-containing protein n=1 Tax=Hesseltinella vesiculosa TaxID=101127 RepID=A0A1X2G708_9FUNG|nr:hypothetical protein DM01DRAFT_1339406 [Hesseltinella vesiculosa]
MSLSFPFSLGNAKKKRQSIQSPLRDQRFPTLSSIVQPKNTPNPSPTSSSSSNSLAIPNIPQPPPESLDLEELEDNRFYTCLRSHYNSLFIRSSVVCIPHSTSLQPILISKESIETHCFNASPYYRGQYQSLNGKVISIDQPLITTISGFKEHRLVHILTEEWVYIGNKKIRVFLVQKPLEGDAVLPSTHKDAIAIPATRNIQTDLEFLNMFPENAEALQELQIAVQEFVDTYVYIRGFNNYTVEKIQHIFAKTHKTIRQSNKRIRDACRVQADYDHYLELVENVVMGYLHEKIWIHSLWSSLMPQDTYLRALCQCYTQSTVTLRCYALSYPISEMPLSSFQSAITCLQRTDTDLASTYPLAYTPLEKLHCLKTTLDLITKAVDDYTKELTSGESFVTTDDMIPLLAYVLTHAQLSRLVSLAFYMEHFRLSHVERQELSFALATLKTAIGFLRGDPLSLMESGSGPSSVSSCSTTSTIVSPKLQSYRTRSTSFGSPITSPSLPHQVQQHHPRPFSPHHPLHHGSPSSPHATARTVTPPLPPLPASPPATHTLRTPKSTTPLRHRKSQSADIQNLIDEWPSTLSLDEAVVSDMVSDHPMDRSRQSPALLARAPIALHHQQQQSRHSLDIPKDWLLHEDRPTTSSSTSSIGSQSTPDLLASHSTKSLGLSQPLISTTLPTFSNSTPLPPSHTPTALSTSSLPSSSTTSCLLGSPHKPASTPGRLYPSNDDHHPHHAVLSSSMTPTPRFANGRDDLDAKVLGRSFSTSTVKPPKRIPPPLRPPPQVINLPDHVSVDLPTSPNRRPASICIDTRSMRQYQPPSSDNQEELGDFLLGLQKVSGDIIGERSGEVRMF